VSAAALRRELRRSASFVSAAVAAMAACERCEQSLVALSALASSVQLRRVAQGLDSSASFLLQAAKAAAGAGGDRDRRLNELERSLDSGSADNGRLDGIDARVKLLSHGLDEAREGMSAMQSELVDRASKRELEEALRTLTDGLRDGVGAEELRRRLGALANLVDAKADETELQRLQGLLASALARLKELSRPQRDVNALLSTRKCMSCGRHLPPDQQDVEMADLLSAGGVGRPAPSRGRGRLNVRPGLVPVAGAGLPGAVSSLKSAPQAVRRQMRHLYGGSTTQRRNNDFLLSAGSTTQPRPKGRNPLMRPAPGLPSVAGRAVAGPEHPAPQSAARQAPRQGRRGSNGGFAWPAPGQGGRPGGYDDLSTQSMPALPHAADLAPVAGGSADTAGAADPGAAAPRPGTDAGQRASGSPFYTSAQRSSGQYFAQFTVAGTKRAGGSGGGPPAGRARAGGSAGATGDGWLGLSPVHRTSTGGIAAGAPPTLPTADPGSLDTLTGRRLGPVGSPTHGGSGRRRPAGQAERGRDVGAGAGRPQAHSDGEAAMSPHVMMPSALSGSPGRATAADLRRRAGEELAAAEG